MKKWAPDSPFLMVSTDRTGRSGFLYKHRTIWLVIFLAHFGQWQWEVEEYMPHMGFVGERWSYYNTVDSAKVT